MKKELNIFTFLDLLQLFPYKHLDRTQIKKIADINPSMDYVQVAGRIISLEVIGERKGKRLVVEIKDDDWAGMARIWKDKFFHG